MVKIKQKKTMNLPQLIEWGFNNPNLVKGTNDKSLNYLDKTNLKSAYTMGDDLRLILIWRDGKLVE